MRHWTGWTINMLLFCGAHLPSRSDVIIMKAAAVCMIDLSYVRFAEQPFNPWLRRNRRVWTGRRVVITTTKSSVPDQLCLVMCGCEITGNSNESRARLWRPEDYRISTAQSDARCRNRTLKHVSGNGRYRRQR